MSHASPEISQEFRLARFANGVKLLRPERSPRKISMTRHISGYTVESILKLPFCIYFIDVTGAQICVNDLTSIHCGFGSHSKATGKVIYDCLDPLTTFSVRSRDRDVLQSRHIKMSEFNVMRKDGFRFQTLSIKIPWYNAENEIIGLFGCASIIGCQSIISSLQIITELGFINLDTILSTKIQAVHRHQIGAVYLTQRETDILKLTVRGKTAIQTAGILSLSYRTIEEYIATLKMKFNANSKSELIDKVFDYIR